MTDPDIINTLAGLTPDSRLALTRDRKPVTRENAQASFRALFEPAEPGTFAFHERFAIASFVAELHSRTTSKRSTPLVCVVPCRQRNLSRHSRLKPTAAALSDPMGLIPRVH
jgi:hypothetical protein